MCVRFASRGIAPSSLLLLFLPIGIRATAQDSALPSAGTPASLNVTSNLDVEIEELRDDLEDAVNARDLRAQALLLDRIGAMYHSHGAHAGALTSFQQVLALARELKEPTAEATALCDIGSSDFALGRGEEALAAYKAALPIWRKLDNRDHEAATLGSMGEIFRALDDSDEALYFGKQSVTTSSIAPGPISLSGTALAQVVARRSA